jgi:serine/threonine-protein kinase
MRPDARNFRNPRFSPDGRKLAVTVISGEGSDIYVYDRGDHTLARLTTDGVNSVPEWSPDGKRVLFKSTHDAQTPIRWRLADGSGPIEQLYDPEEPINEALLSPDGNWLIYRTAPNAAHVRDIFAVPLTGDRKPVLIEGGPSQESHPRLSPDGHWLAYASNESGRFEIFVRPFPNAGSKRQVSVDGGSEPVWSRSGRQLYYRAPGGIVAANVTTGSTFTLGERKVVLTGDYAEDLTHANFDITPDGNQFVALRASGGESSAILVHNGGRELREKLGLEKKPPR